MTNKKVATEDKKYVSDNWPCSDLDLDLLVIMKIPYKAYKYSTTRCWDISPTIITDGRTSQKHTAFHTDWKRHGTSILIHWNITQPCYFQSCNSFKSKMQLLSADTNGVKKWDIVPWDGLILKFFMVKWTFSYIWNLIKNKVGLNGTAIVESPI